jgi:hypothetical protein
MRLEWFGLGILAGMIGLAVATAQSPAPLTCEQQVSDSYQALGKDQLLVVVPDLPWSQQLSEIASAPRQLNTRWEIKRNQTDLAEKNVAQLLEQLRQAQAQIAALKTQLPHTPAPAN